MQMEDNITVKMVDQMGSEELARWLCLFEAIDAVSAQASKLNVDLSKNNDWIKPLTFKTYIKETYFSMLDKVCHYRNEIPDFTQPAYNIIDVNEVTDEIEAEVLEEITEDINEVNV